MCVDVYCYWLFNLVFFVLFRLLLCGYVVMYVCVCVFCLRCGGEQRLWHVPQPAIHKQEETSVWASQMVKKKKKHK